MQIAIGRCTGLGMAHLTLRLDDEMLYAVDALARAAGMTRSRWIARAIIDALPARPEEVRDVPIGEGASKMVSLRFPLERSEEHTSELQSLMRISYAVFCLKKKTIHNQHKGDNKMSS